jgi:hypothetical protein
MLSKKTILLLLIEPKIAGNLKILIGVAHNNSSQDKQIVGFLVPQAC